MKQNFELAKMMAKNISDSCQGDLEDINIWPIFSPLYKKYTIEIANTLTAFVIFAYDNDSKWLNFNQDRHDNKVKIIKSLGSDPTHPFFEKKLSNLDEEFNDLIAQYLQSQVTYKWMMALTYLDYSAEMLAHARKKPEGDKTTEVLNKEGEKHKLVEDFDEEKINKINIQRAGLLERAEKARTDAERLLSEINREFLQLNQAVQADFGFEMTEEKTLHYDNWRDFIRNVAVPYRKSLLPKQQA